MRIVALEEHFTVPRIVAGISPDAIARRDARSCQSGGDGICPAVEVGPGPQAAAVQHGRVDGSKAGVDAGGIDERHADGHGRLPSHSTA